MLREVALRGNAARQGNSSCLGAKKNPQSCDWGSPSCGGKRGVSFGISRVAASLVLREVELLDQFSLTRS